MGSRGGPSCKEAAPQRLPLHCMWPEPLEAVLPGGTGRHKAPILQDAFSPCTPCCSSSPCVGPRLPSVPPGPLERAAPRPAMAQAWWLSPIRASQHPKGACSLSPSHASRVPCPRQGWKVPPGTAHAMHPASMAYKTCPVQGNTSPPQARGEKNKSKQTHTYETKENILPKQYLHKSLSFSFFLEVAQ